MTFMFLLQYRMVSHHLLNHNKLHILFQVSKILIILRSQNFSKMLRKTWFVQRFINDKQNTCCSVLLWFTLLQNILVQDPTLLEIAWVELLEKNASVTAEELAEVHIFL